MKPVIALIGRPNVGKSTLFNRITRTRDALVADFPGLTRDRKVGEGRLAGGGYLVVDTAGIGQEQPQELAALVERHSLTAAAEADAIVLLVDARAGLMDEDVELAEALRPLGLPLWLVVNKAEGLNPDLATADFHALGLGLPIPISAAHGTGVELLIEDILETLRAASAAAHEQAPGEVAAAVAPEEEDDSGRIRVTVVGRPNVGKSTLINRMVGEDRVLAFDAPGTTRDAIHVPFERDGIAYTLIDTAGVRRRGRVEQVIEKFSVVKTLQAIDEAHVALLLIDASETITVQDTHLLGLVLESGRALVIAVNKWDGLAPDHRERVRTELDRKLRFIDYARVHFISALHGTGVGDLFTSIRRAHRSAATAIPTALLNDALERAVEAHQPPMVHGRRIKLRFAHPGGTHPPTIVIHGNQVEAVPTAYTRYLEKHFRSTFGLEGTPVRIEYRQGENPFAGRRNTLTPRQVQKRKRLVTRRRSQG
jgi:GTP-binding protein